MSPLLTVTGSTSRTLLRSDGVAVRSPVHPQRVPALCPRCASQVEVLSGTPGSSVERRAECPCGHVYIALVERGELGGQICTRPV